MGPRPVKPEEDGILQVYHNATLGGKGTQKSPLGALGTTATSITEGVTEVVGVTDGYVLINNSGLLGEVDPNTLGGSGLLPLIGTGTATGDVIGDLDGNSLTFKDGQDNQLIMSDGQLLYYAYEPDVDLVQIDLSNSLTRFIQVDGANYVQMDLQSNEDAGRRFSVQAYVDGIGSTSFEMDGATQSFTFNSNVGIGATPTADQLFVGKYNGDELIKAGINESLLIAEDENQDGYSQVALSSVLGNTYTFNLESKINGSGQKVAINGDAVAQTIALTAVNGVLGTLYKDNGDGITISSDSSNSNGYNFEIGWDSSGVKGVVWIKSGTFAIDNVAHNMHYACNGIPGGTDTLANAIAGGWNVVGGILCPP